MSVTDMNTRDVDDIYLEAVAFVTETLDEIFVEFDKPDNDMAVLSIWRVLPEEVKAQLRITNPKEVSHIELLAKE
jgi:hypothetical protein